MQYRLRRTDDIEIIHELDRQCFNAQTPAIDEDDLNDATWWLVEASVEGDWVPVGYGGVQPAPKGACLTRAGVLKAHRGAGLQKRLIRVRVAWAKAHGYARCYTYVWAGNLASMRSLIRQQFVPYYWERGEVTFIYFERKFASATPIEKA